MRVDRNLYLSVGGFPAMPLMEDVAISDLLKKFSAPVLLPGPITLSSRHWKRPGVILTTLRNKLLYSLHRLGVSPERVANLYRH